MRMKASLMILALTATMAFGTSLFAQTPSAPTTQEQPQSPTPQSPNPETTPLPDRNPEQQAPEAQPQQTAPTSAQSGQPSMKTFSGTIVKVSDKYVLEDTATNSKYDLDNQSTAKQYDGKQVTVTGSLDANSVLHVETIELAK